MSEEIAVGESAREAAILEIDAHLLWRRSNDERTEKMGCHVQIAIDSALVEKDKRISELEGTLRQSIADRLVELNSLMTTRNNQQLRIAEARRLIKQIGSIEIKFYEDANKWLDGNP